MDQLGRLQTPTLFGNEMEWLIYDTFNVIVSRYTIFQELYLAGWTRKRCRQVALERSAHDRDIYFAIISQYTADQLVFVDKLGADSKTGVRKTGWAPYGVAPVSHTPYNRGETRLNILPAYTIDGVLVASVYEGSTNGEGFKFWVANTLLPRCNRFPAKRSVVVIDNASFHHLERMQALFDAFGVKLIYLPAYLPNLNPIEEFFRELKAFIWREWFS